MLHHNISTFKHSGDRGDLIYALPTIQALGGGILYMNHAPSGRFTLEDGSLSLFNTQKIESIIPLLKEQDYIVDAKIWDNEEIHYDLDNFRYRNLREYNLADAHLETFGISYLERNNQWLTISNPCKIDYPIVIARSPRYHSPHIHWKHIYPFIKDRSVFVGHPLEHAAFQRVCGNLPYIYTDNMLELAQVIAAATIFIGNQSCPYAIAEGLKKACVLEVCPYVPNCCFNRDDCYQMHVPTHADNLEHWSKNRGIL